MTQMELSQVVDRVMNDPRIEACFACILHSNEIVERHRSDSRVLHAEWREHGDSWRCTVTAQPNRTVKAAQVDLHENGTVRTVAFLPCQITVCQEEGFLWLSL